MRSDRHGEQITQDGQVNDWRPAISGDGFASWPGAWEDGDGASGDYVLGVYGDGASGAGWLTGGGPA